MLRMDWYALVACDMTAEFAWYDVCDWTRSVISVPRSTTGNSTFPWAFATGSVGSYSSWP